MPKLKRKTLLAAITVVVAVLGFTVAFIHEWRVIKKEPITIWTEDVTADCAVALTGGPQRIREGLDLLARKSIQKLIISGVNPNSHLRDIFPQAPAISANKMSFSNDAPKPPSGMRNKHCPSSKHFDVATSF